MVQKIKPSTTGIATDAPISVYAGSKENADLLASQKKVFPGNIVGATYAASTQLETDDVDFEVDLVVDDFDSSIINSTENSNQSVFLDTPRLSDVSIISNQVVYDAAGNPSVTVVLKIKNSSGQELKGMNARIQALW